MLFENVFKLETSKEVFHVLVDAFFAVGCVIFCLGAIAYSANKGAFTMLGYSMKRFISLFSKKWIVLFQGHMRNIELKS